MNTNNIVAEARMMCCASCGKSELDGVKLMECNDCKYCSYKCQKDHRPQHKATCKERAPELRDEILFRQPEISHLGDCPICFLPLPFDQRKSTLMGCCSKVVCTGCSYTDMMREKRGGQLDITCPFCRHPLPETEEESNANTKKRAEKNDPVAMAEIGKKHYQKGEYQIAFDYLTKAAKLGDLDAHCLLGSLYGEGKGVEKDKKKELYYLEEAAIAGHIQARYGLACYEGRDGRFDRSVKHFIIAANLGLDEAIQALKGYYKDGFVSKEDFAAALRAQHAAVDATKSPQREAAAKAYASTYKEYSRQRH